MLVEVVVAVVVAVAVVFSMAAGLTNSTFGLDEEEVELGLYSLVTLR